MDEALIRNWNARVKPDDTVYVLGDMFFKYKQSNVAIMAKLNGHKHLIKGNHDWGKVLEEPWESVQPYLEIGDENRRVILCHFPIPFYNRARRGSIMLYGHVHSSIDWELQEKWKQECQELGLPCNMINVGCMMPYMNYTPRTLGGILAANPVCRDNRRNGKMIICAAIQVQFERNGRKIETVIHDLRHANCWETMAALGIPAQHTEVEGFIDDKNRFLDRYDAFAHALECGQLPETVRIHKADHRENQLYSEDLY